MNNLLNEKWLEALPEKVTENLIKQNTEVIKVICERIKYFGDLRPTEIKKLTNSVAFAGTDMKAINKIIQNYTNLNNKEIKKIFETAAKENDAFAEQYYQYRGLVPKTHSNDEYLKNIFRAIKQSTLEEFENLSDTYGFKFPSKKAMTLRQTYYQSIDKAIYEIQTGVTDYKTALRQTVMRLADSGIRTINWESGVSRRADTAARMNILDGVRRLNQEMLLYNGEQFSSDGIELSAHAISAPDHVKVQGRQFSNAEFNKMQDGESSTDINGNTYDSFERPIGEWNCKHFAFPIVIGVSKPVHTDEELLRLKQNSTEKYDATQEMRRRETEIRKLKDRRMAFSAAGNELDAKRTQRNLNIALKDYGNFCENNSLTPKYDRMEVGGYKKISVEGLQNLENRDILKSKIAKGELTLVINSEMQNRHILGKDEYSEGRSYFTISTEEIQHIIDTKYATGKVAVFKNGQIKETIFTDKIIGVDKDFDGKEYKTNGLKIHYSKSRTHAVPHSRRNT